MKSLIASTVLVFSFAALADIPRPPVSHSAVDVAVTGQDAVELYESLNVRELRGSALRTSSSTFKVFRAESGLTQIVCEKTVSRFNDEFGSPKTTGSCKVSKSTDGKPLAKFKPLIRMG